MTHLRRIAGEAGDCAEKEKANPISQTGLYLMPATTGFYPEVKPKDSHTLSRAVIIGSAQSRVHHSETYRHA
jgi:hypothetical protein